MKKGSIGMKSVIVLLVLGGLAASSIAAVTTFTPAVGNLNDLDHYRYYVWNIDLGSSVKPQTITGASITFNSIYDWNGGNVNDVLYLNLLDWKSSIRYNEIYLANPTLIQGNDSRAGNQFGSVNLIDSLVVTGDIGIGHASARTFSVDFSESLLGTLRNYATDGKIALGFDPDCHFYNAGVEFTINTDSTPVVPAPAAVSLGGVGIMLVGWLRTRKTLK